ncbi:MAG TPA: SCO family protein [Caulobacteraceae bacterium]|nr:SCO family protein [Caulobacteraceae bacterium]
MRVTSFRIWAWSAAGLAALALGVFVLVRPAAQPATTQASAPIGGPFRMTDQNGRAVSQDLLKGKWSAVYFGYTYCPDVCPTTLQMLGSVDRGLGARAKDFQVVFVTVDPARDTPSQLKLYLSNSVFPPGAIGLTGTPAEVAGIAGAYGVYYQKQGSGPGYSVNHSSAIYLMNPKGGFDSVIAADSSPDQAKTAILKAMNG